MYFNDLRPKNMSILDVFKKNDLWALGIIIFELTSYGYQFPKKKSTKTIYEKNLDYAKGGDVLIEEKYPEYMDSPFYPIVSGLLRYKMEDRISLEQVKEYLEDIFVQSE